MTTWIEERLSGNEIKLRKGDELPGGYVVERRLGAGATAVIFEATAGGKRYAVKVLRPEVLEHAFVREKFEGEVQILTRLEHPNIVRVHDSIREGRLVACVLELVNGSTLEQYLPLHRGGLSEVLALQLAMQVVDAMSYAHSFGIVHRDLKPSNVLVQQEGAELRAVVADFGLAKALGKQSNTRTGLRIGTVAYMAPEQVHDSSRVDERADIYALGITLYECLTGSLPFPHKSIYEVVQAQLTQPIPAVRNRRMDVSERWDEIISKACEKPREARYQTASEMLVDLHELADGIGAIGRNTIALAPVNPARVSLLPPAESDESDPRVGTGTALGGPAGEPHEQPDVGRDTSSATASDARATAVANLPPPAFASAMQAESEHGEFGPDDEPPTDTVDAVATRAQLVSSVDSLASAAPGGFSRDATDKQRSPDARRAALRAPAATVSQVHRSRDQAGVEAAGGPESNADIGLDPTPDTLDAVGERELAYLEGPGEGDDAEGVTLAGSQSAIPSAASEGHPDGREPGLAHPKNPAVTTSAAYEDTVDSAGHEHSAGRATHAGGAAGAALSDGDPAGAALASDLSDAALAARRKRAAANRDERRDRALELVTENDRSRPVFYALVGLVLLSLAALAIGLYVATR